MYYHYDYCTFVRSICEYGSVLNGLLINQAILSKLEKSTTKIPTLPFT